MKTATICFIFSTLIGFISLADTAGNLCQVHGVSMSYQELPYEVTGELTREQVEEEKIRESLFPHGREFTPTGCLPLEELGMREAPMGFVCPKCVRARLAWLAQFAVVE
jgi:hypothetical protein